MNKVSLSPSPEGFGEAKVITLKTKSLYSPPAEGLGEAP